MVTERQAALFLKTRFGQPVDGLAPIGVGEWSRAYAYRLAGQEYVIRFSTHGEDFAKDRLATRYASASLPVPPLLEVGEAYDGSYAIATRVAGSYLDDVDASQMRELLPALLAVLDELRAADIAATRGYGLWDATGTAPFASWRAALGDVVNDRPTDRIYGWRARLAASATGMGPFSRALTPFQALLEQVPEERSLIHRDLLHFNVLVADSRITAVLDWGDSWYGDFVYEVAWLAFWSAWYPAWRDIDFASEAQRHFAAIGLTVPDFAARLRCYELHIGLDGQAYCAFAGHWDDLAWTARRTLEVVESLG